LGEFFFFYQCLKNSPLGPGSQDVIAFFCEVREDFNYLLDSFTGAVDNLRKATPNLPMMVNAGKAQILKRQQPQFFNCLLDVNFTAFYLL